MPVDVIEHHGRGQQKGEGISYPPSLPDPGRSRAGLKDGGVEPDIGRRSHPWPSDQTRDSSERISPKRLVVTMTSNCQGLSTSCIGANVDDAFVGLDPALVGFTIFRAQK